MEKKTALLCDSSADVTEEEAKELGIHVLRMPVIIEGKEYLEGVSVFDSDILEALRAQKKITTTQPSAGDGQFGHWCSFIGVPQHADIVG